MATTIKVLNADVSVDRDYVYELSKQYDNQSRKYRVLITDRGVPVSLTGNEGILLRMQAEGESNPYVLRWIDEWENGYPILTMSNYMLSKIGIVHFEFVIYDAPGGSAVLSTRQQNMKVQKSLLNYDGLVASEDFDILSDLINQARVIPEMINDFNASKEEINVLITQIQNDISNYQSQFTIMQDNVDELIQSTETYIQQLTANVNTTLTQANTAVSTANQLIATADNTLEQVTLKASEASNYADLAERFAIGGKIPEDAEDNARWYWQQTKKLKDQVDLAVKLSVPDFYIDFEEMELCSETEAKGINFWIDDGTFYGEEVI